MQSPSLPAAQPAPLPVPQPGGVGPGQNPAVSGEVTSLDDTRARVRAMLLRSPAFLELSPDERRRVAHDTVNVFHFLGDAAPYEMLSGPAAAAMAMRGGGQPMARPMEGFGSGGGFGGNSGSSVNTGSAQGRVPAQDPTYASSEPPEGQFRAGAAREGAAVAGALLQSVNFVEFVGGLIQNVYVAIVDASIKQMQAYAEMVSSVAKSVDEFKRDNISANQGRDYVVDQFPDLFEISTEGDFFGEGQGEPRVALREGVDEREAAERVSSEFNLGAEAPRGLDSDTLERIIVPAAQMQLALSRQRLLAITMLMGINKIVVTDGRISAKVMYNFRSRDVFASKTRAEEFDYGDQMKTVRRGAYDRGDEGYNSEYSRTKDGDYEGTTNRGKRWSKGRYQTTQEPVIEMRSVNETQTMGSLEATAALAGSVDINFKSETVDLNLIANSTQMNQLQGAAGLMQGAIVPGASPGTAATTPQPGGTQTQPPAPQAPAQG